MFACKYLARDEEHAKDKELAAYGILWDHRHVIWVFPFAPDLCTIRVCRFMQLRRLASQVNLTLNFLAKPGAC